MSQALVQIDSAASATLSATAVIPVLNGAVTGTGNANAAQVLLSDPKTFFEGGVVDELTSIVAIATPSALTATQFTGFASTVSGATLMGYGTTADVTLKNRAGTDVIVVTSNTTGVTMAGALLVAGVATLGASAGTAGVVIDGTSFGAGVASLRLNGLTTTAGANVGTLTNCPHTGNPTVWVPINIGGTVYAFPGFALS
jgi:hypothetical protein